jgi:hypothetical protein
MPLAPLVLAALTSTTPASAPTAPSSAPPPQAWLGVQERNVWGLAAEHATDDYGADLLAGLWLLDQRLEPIVDLGWSRVTGPQNGDTIDTFRAGAKLAAGCPLADDQLWVGAALGLVVQTGWLRPTTSGSPLAWAVSPSLSGLLQERFARRFLVGAELGVEHAIPALKWADYSVFNAFRLQLGIELGVIF